MSLNGFGDNYLLRVMSDNDFQMVQSLLEPVEWTRGQMLVEPDERIDYAFFPTRGLVSVLALTTDDRRYEVGMYGREGVGPIALLSGAIRTSNQHIVQASGAALRIGQLHLQEVLSQSPTFKELLVRYVDVFHVQVGQTALSNASGDLGQRLARWLLMYQDRLETDDLQLSNEVLGIMLGIQPSKVAEATVVLARTDIIHATEGNIQILDRSLLEKAAGDSYGVPEAEYNRLLPAL